MWGFLPNVCVPEGWHLRGSACWLLGVWRGVQGSAAAGDHTIPRGCCSWVNMFTSGQGYHCSVNSLQLARSCTANKLRLLFGSDGFFSFCACHTRLQHLPHALVTCLCPMHSMPCPVTGHRSRLPGSPARPRCCLRPARGWPHEWRGQPHAGHV